MIETLFKYLLTYCLGLASGYWLIYFVINRQASEIQADKKKLEQFVAKVQKVLDDDDANHRIGGTDE